jgi:hypothetical protein
MLSFGGATVKFDKLLSKGAELIEEAPAPLALSDVQPELGLPDPHRDIKPENVVAHPGAGIFNIFAGYDVTEQLLAQIAEQLRVKTRETNTIMRMLLKRDLISPELAELHSTLRQARNTVAHGRAFVATESEANEYLRQALHLNLALRTKAIKGKSCLYRQTSVLKGKKVKTIAEHLGAVAVGPAACGCSGPGPAGTSRLSRPQVNRRTREGSSRPS